MSGDLQLIIKNHSKRTTLPKEPYQKDEFSLPFLTSVSKDNADVSDRLRRLQGNMKLLERQYRANLKEGFDNKIKAYRMEAVV